MSRVSERFRIAKVRFYKEDLDALQRYFPNAGYNRVVRELVHSFLRKLDDQTARRLSPDEALRDTAEGIEIDDLADDPPAFDAVGWTEGQVDS